MIEWYHNMLNYIQTKYEKDNKRNSPTELERKFIDTIKTIIEGGYSVSEKEFLDILENITSPQEITPEEIKFLKYFIQGIKLNLPQNKFTQVFSREN